MKSIKSKALLIITLSAASSLSSAETGNTSSIFQSCMPKLGGENILSIPNDCSYAIDAYLGNHINPLLIDVNSAFSGLPNNVIDNSIDLRSCDISETMQTNISGAISNKLASAGESTAKIEELINETLSDQYPC